MCLPLGGCDWSDFASGQIYLIDTRAMLAYTPPPLPYSCILTFLYITPLPLFQSISLNPQHNVTLMLHGFLILIVSCPHPFLFYFLFNIDSFPLSKIIAYESGLPISIILTSCPVCVCVFWKRFPFSVRFPPILFCYSQRSMKPGVDRLWLIQFLVSKPFHFFLTSHFLSPLCVCVCVYMCVCVYVCICAYVCLCVLSLNGKI